MFYELPSWATRIAFAAALFGLLMALVLCIPVFAGALSKRDWPDLATGTLLGAGAVYLGVYAGSQDTYFTSFAIRRWDSFSGAHGVAIAAISFTVLAVIGLVAARWAGPRRSRVRGTALVVAVVAFGLQLTGYFGLSIGH